MEKNNNIDDGTDLILVNILFRKLSDEKKIMFIKTLIYSDIARDFIDTKTRFYADNMINTSATEQELEKFESNLCSKTNKTVYSMLKTMYGEDDELKYKIFQNFVDNYNFLESEMKHKICGYNHAFTEWVEEVGEVPQYDEDGDITGYISDKKYYERTCTYCGEVQKAYSESHREKIEEETEYWANRFPQKTICAKQRKITRTQNKEQQ